MTKVEVSGAGRQAGARSSSAHLAVANDDGTVVKSQRRSVQVRLQVDDSGSEVSRHGGGGVRRDAAGGVDDREDCARKLVASLPRINSDFAPDRGFQSCMELCVVAAPRDLLRQHVRGRLVRAEIYVRQSSDSAEGGLRGGRQLMVGRRDGS